MLGGNNHQDVVDDHDHDDGDEDPKKFDDVPLLDDNNNNNNNSSLFSKNRINSNNNGDDADCDDFLTSASSTSAALFQLRIKSFKNVEVAVPINSNVFQLRELIKHALGKEETKDRYMRLICKGKLLHPDSSPLSEFKVHNDDVVHAVLAAKGVRAPTERVVSVVPGTTNTTTATNTSSATTSSSNNSNTSNLNTQPQQGRRRRGGTVVGPGGRVTRLVQRNNNNTGLWNLSSNNDDDDDSFSSLVDDDDDDDDDIEHGTSSTTQQRRGFDRLRSAGLSRQEITAIRTYFNRHVDRYVQQHPNDHQDEHDLLTRRRLFEEDWMAVQSPTSEFRLNLNQNTLLRFAAASNGSGSGRIGLGGTAISVGGASGVNWNTVQRPSSSSSSQPTVGTDRDFMWGFFLGFFVGFVMLLWIWIPTVPHKQKVGILAGISFSLAANVLNDAEREDLLD
eukprot:CAMPEP_0113457562 /NCGR_PEP_ID=MMETSP0014_2-20120614/9473_1 /TAXON_ID=2857 /ORGANISM="Nitzschia sp." /LENGTH=448 /DNA_ID=CAMNT_0000349063 /DNA_START=364 /DNA_END=1710 /DNA_ORIENTATION=- /assembly_acc=CAM_ASM_000159